MPFERAGITGFADCRASPYQTVPPRCEAAAATASRSSHNLIVRSSDPIMREPNAIDFWRGLALVTIYVNHIPGNTFERYTYSQYGISDAAELFVFLAGWSIGIATRGRDGRPETASEKRAEAPVAYDRSLPCTDHHYGDRPGHDRRDGSDPRQSAPSRMAQCRRLLRRPDPDHDRFRRTHASARLLQYPAALRGAVGHCPDLHPDRPREPYSRRSSCPSASIRQASSSNGTCRPGRARGIGSSIPCAGSFSWCSASLPRT